MAQEGFFARGWGWGSGGGWGHQSRARGSAGGASGGQKPEPETQGHRQGRCGCAEGVGAGRNRGRGTRDLTAVTRFYGTPGRGGEAWKQGSETCPGERWGLGNGAASLPCQRPSCFLAFGLVERGLQPAARCRVPAVRAHPSAAGRGRLEEAAHALVPEPVSGPHTPTAALQILRCFPGNCFNLARLPGTPHAHGCLCLAAGRLASLAHAGRQVWSSGARRLASSEGRTLGRRRPGIPGRPHLESRHGRGAPSGSPAVPSRGKGGGGRRREHAPPTASVTYKAVPLSRAFQVVPASFGPCSAHPCRPDPICTVARGQNRPPQNPRRGRGA